MKIASVTAKIFLIWTNVARTNVAWTNVTVTAGICCRCSLYLKFGPNRVSNSWDISDMEKMSPGKMSQWLLEYVLDVPRNLPVKLHQNQVSNSWDIPNMDICHQDKCCVDKCHRESVLNVHRNLPLKFHQNRVSNSWDIANIEFVWGGGLGRLGLVSLVRFG